MDNHKMHAMRRCHREFFPTPKTNLNKKINIMSWATTHKKHIYLLNINMAKAWKNPTLNLVYKVVNK